jgi:hypothetical protein
MQVCAMNKKRIIILLIVMFSLLGVMIFLRCKKPLPDNPDIRSYMDMAASGVTFDYLKNHLPKEIIKEESRYKKEHTVPKFRGTVYYDLHVTNKACFAFIEIEQEGNHWSYSGRFYFNSDDICYAVKYESWTRYMEPIAFKHYWKPSAAWQQSCIINKKNPTSLLSEKKHE